MEEDSMAKESKMSENFRKSNDERMRDTIHQSLGEKYMLKECIKLCNMNGIEMPIMLIPFE